MVLGELGLFRERTGADRGLVGWLEGRLKGLRAKKPLVGLTEWHPTSP